jgi:hypothetical protein
MFRYHFSPQRHFLRENPTLVCYTRATQENPSGPSDRAFRPPNCVLWSTGASALATYWSSFAPCKALRPRTRPVCERSNQAVWSCAPSRTPCVTACTSRRIALKSRIRVFKWARGRGPDAQPLPGLSGPLLTPPRRIEIGFLPFQGINKKTRFHSRTNTLPTFRTSREHIASAELIQMPLQFGPVPAVARRLLPINTLAFRRSQRRHLSSDVLVIGGDASTADQHAQTHRQMISVKQHCFATRQSLQILIFAFLCKDVRFCKQSEPPGRGLTPYSASMHPLLSCGSRADSTTMRTPWPRCW